MKVELTDEQFIKALKYAVDHLHTGYFSDNDLDRNEKIIGHCALYFSSRNRINNSKIELTDEEIGQIIMCIECVDFMDKKDEELIEKLKGYLRRSFDGLD